MHVQGKKYAALLLFRLTYSGNNTQLRDANYKLQLLVLGSIQKLTGIVSLGSVAMASGTFGNWLGKHKSFIKWQERFTGVVMVALGIRMLLGGSGVLSKSTK